MQKRKFSSYAFWCSLAVLSVALFMNTACSDDDDKSAEVQTPLFSNGDEVVSQLLVDDVVVEELEEQVVNMGTEEAPALFFIRKKHMANGQNVTSINNANNAYRSLTREDLEKFIYRWGKIFGLDFSSENTTENIKKKAEAFWILAAFLRENKIDPAVLIKLAEQRNEDLKSLIAVIDESHAVASKRKDSPNQPNHILVALDKKQSTAKELIQSIESENVSVKDFFEKCELSGVHIPATICNSQVQTKAAVSSIIKGVLKGVELVSKVIIFFVENGAPSVSIEDTYINFLHKNDLNPNHYVDSKTSTSKKYEARYGNKKTPLAQAVFYVEAEYDAKHKTLPGSYLVRVGMIVDKVKCSGLMHVDGKMDFTPPFENIGTEANPIASAVGNIWVDYGDCCCFSRHAYLSFRVSGNSGYKELTWDPKH